MSLPSRHSIEAEFQPLTEDDLRRFESSFINPELARQAASRVDSTTGSKIVNRNGKGDYAGLVFTYREPWDAAGSPVLYVLRPDHPDIKIVDGKEKQQKYLVAGESRQRLYFPPGINPSWLADASIPIVLVEGEKKALALWRLAWHGLGEAAEKPLFIPIGLRGVDGWQGRLGKETAPDGTRVDVRGPIADLQRVVWRGRRVVILFDTNVKSNTSVRRAREALTAELERHAARVSWFEWPSDTPASVNGVDDYLAIVGPDKVLKLIEAARPTKPTAKQQSECKREFEQLDEGRYRLTLPSIGVKFEVDRLRRDRHELMGELSVFCDLPGATTFEGALSTADFNLSSARARTDRAKLLVGRVRATELDFFGLLEEFCTLVLRADRTGQPAVDLRDLVRPGPEDSLFVDGLILPRRHPAIIFGDGGALKSYFALYVAACLAKRGFTVAFFDWELAGEDHRDRLQRLFGTSMPQIFYVRCERPLVYEVDRLRRITKERNIDYAIFDSVAFACAGPPESAEIAGQYFRACRQVGAGSLHVAHISRGEGNDQKPFGSAFWHNGARSTWFVKCTESDEQTLKIGLFHRKSNLGRLHQPTGFQITFTDEQTTFKRANPADTPDLAVKMTIRQRMTHLLKAGAVMPETIAEELEADVETVKRTVRRYKDLFTVLDGGKLALLERNTS